jgi:hypothetical protein
MSGNLDGFDATTVDPNMGFEPVPKNDYLSMMTDSEFKPTKANDGSEYLQCTWEILEGEYKKRLIFGRLNVRNKSDAAVKIAEGELSAICHAVGVLKPKDSSEFHGKPAILSVDIEERNDKPGSFSNVIKDYSAVGSAQAQPTGSKTETTTDPAKPPWKK